MEYEVRYEVESCVRRYHVYQAIWTPVIGETLKCQKEPNNLADQYAVAVIKREDDGPTKLLAMYLG